MKSILFVGGGSVGHIAPAIAVWNELNELKDLHNAIRAHYICSPRPDDAAFLSRHDIPFTVFNAPRASILFPLKFAFAVRRAKKLLSKHKPDVLFSKGGYVSLPFCFAAQRCGIPIVTHETDTVSGYANRIISTWAACTCTGFPETTRKRKTVYTGNPIRKEITEGSRNEALRITGFDGSRPVLLVSGGSQGSLAINQAITTILDDLLLRCDIIHITGRNKSSGTKNEERRTNHYYQTEFAHEELAHFYAAADIAVSRAGGSVVEHAANGIPMILIPLRGVGHDHQYSNAVIAEKTGGCIHLEQSEMENSLLRTVHTLVTDEEKRASMSKNIRTLYKPDAALQIAKIIAETLDSNGPDQ